VREANRAAGRAGDVSADDGRTTLH
jgi:hypothetical protein